APVAKPIALLSSGGPRASARLLSSCGLSADLRSTRTGLPRLLSQSLAAAWTPLSTPVACSPYVGKLRATSTICSESAGTSRITPSDSSTSMVTYVSPMAASRGRRPSTRVPTTGSSTNATSHARKNRRMMWTLRQLIQRRLNRAVELRVGATRVILRRVVNLDVGVGAVVLDTPADVVEEERELGLCGDRAVNKAVPWPDADDAAPGALAD